MQSEVAHRARHNSDAALARLGFNTHRKRRLLAQRSPFFPQFRGSVQEQESICSRPARVEAVAHQVVLAVCADELALVGGMKPVECASERFLIAPTEAIIWDVMQQSLEVVRRMRDFLDWTQVISWIRTTCEWSPAEPFGDDSYASFFFAASLRALTPR